MLDKRDLIWVAYVRMKDNYHYDKDVACFMFTARYMIYWCQKELMYKVIQQELLSNKK